MSSPLTPKQKRALEEVRRYFKRRGIMPTVRELAAITNSASSTVYQHLRRLETKGWIATDGSPRGLTIRADAPDAGTLKPLDITGEISGTQGIRFSAARRPKNILPIALTRDDVTVWSVRDESLARSGIHPGDLLVVQKSSPRSQTARYPVPISGLDGLVVAVIRES